MKEWEFALETDASAYFWNRVCLYIGRHGRTLQTEAHGAIVLDVPKVKAPRGDEVNTSYSVLAVVASSLDSVSPPEDVVTFFDPDTPGPRTVRLPTRACVWRCSMWPLSGKRMAVRLWTDLPEAVPYIEAMLSQLGYPELSQTPTPPNAPQHAQDLPKGAHLRRWRATWRLVFRDVEKGKSLEDIVKWLGLTHPEADCTADTLRKIVKAGAEGQLD